MTGSDKHLGKLEERLRHWGANLDELATLADACDSEVRVALRAQIDGSRAKHHAAQLKLAEFKAAGSVRWDAFKSGLEGAWSELEDAFKGLKRQPKR